MYLIIQMMQDINDAFPILSNEEPPEFCEGRTFCRKECAFCDKAILLGQENRGFYDDPHDGCCIEYYMTECGGFFVVEQTRCDGSYRMLLTPISREAAIDWLENCNSESISKFVYTSKMLDGFKLIPPRNKDGG